MTAHRPFVAAAVLVCSVAALPAIAAAATTMPDTTIDRLARLDLSTLLDLGIPLCGTLVIVSIATWMLGRKIMNQSAELPERLRTALADHLKDLRGEMAEFHAHYQQVLKRVDLIEAELAKPAAAAEQAETAMAPETNAPNAVVNEEDVVRSPFSSDAMAGGAAFEGGVGAAEVLSSIDAAAADPPEAQTPAPAATDDEDAQMLLKLEEIERLWSERPTEAYARHLEVVAARSPVRAWNGFEIVPATGASKIYVYAETPAQRALDGVKWADSVVLSPWSVELRPTDAGFWLSINSPRSLKKWSLPPGTFDSFETEGRAIVDLYVRGKNTEDSTQLREAWMQNLALFFRFASEYGAKTSLDIRGHISHLHAQGAGADSSLRIGTRLDGLLPHRREKAINENQIKTTRAVWDDEKRDWKIPPLLTYPLAPLPSFDDVRSGELSRAKTKLATPLYKMGRQLGPRDKPVVDELLDSIDYIKGLDASSPQFGKTFSEYYWKPLFTLAATAFGHGKTTTQDWQDWVDHTRECVNKSSAGLVVADKDLEPGAGYVRPELRDRNTNKAVCRPETLGAARS